MERIATSDHLFHDGDPFNNVQGTIVTAEWLNSVQEEIATVVEQAGITLDSTHTDQLFTALLVILAAYSSKCGIATLNVAGNANVVLTSGQANVGILIFMGLLTGNINVIFPASAGKWIVVNQTTGNFTLTCKTAAGTGFAVSQGKVGNLYGEGTNISSALTDFNSVALTGVSTAPTAALGTNTTQIANTAFVAAAVAALVNSSPASLDTLKELADALGDDANFATTITNLLAAKAPINNPVFTGDPKAPTPALGDNDTSIATTAYVNAAIFAAGSPPPKYINAATTVVAGAYDVDTGAGTFLISVTPTPTLGDSIKLRDIYKTWKGANAPTLNLNGKTLMGDAGPFVLNTPNLEFSISYNGSDWRLA